MTVSLLTSSTVRSTGLINVNDRCKVANTSAARIRLQEFDYIANGVELRLLKPLHKEYGRFAQEWSSITPNGNQVIVKVFQICFAPDEPCWNDFMLLHFIPEEEHAHREYWAYNRLQGSLIPHSYGFY